MGDYVRECSEPDPTTTSWTTPPTPDSRATEAGTPLSHFLSPRSSTRGSTPVSLTWRETPFCPGFFPSGEPTLSYRLFHTSLTPLLLKVMRYTSSGDGPTTQQFPEQKMFPSSPSSTRWSRKRPCNERMLCSFPCTMSPSFDSNIHHILPFVSLLFIHPSPLSSNTGASLSCISDLTFEPPSWGRKVTS